MGLGPAETEDILQDVLIQALKRGGELACPEELVRWLIRVTVNRGMLEFRRRQRFRKAVADFRQRVVAEAGLAAGRTNNLAVLVEKLEAVRQALRELDERLLSPLVLRYFCELDATQISRILELPASTVRSRLREARLMLAKRLIERGVEP